LKAGIAQIALHNDIVLNMAKMCSCIESATTLGLDILCFPECSLTGYLRDFRTISQDEVIRAMDELQEIAANRGITILIGSPYIEEGKTYNAALVISPNARMRYFKNNLTDFDKRYFVEGKDILSFKVKNTKCGVLICRDQNYPSLAFEYARRRTKIIFLLSAHYYPYDQTKLKLEKNRALPIARAVENGIFIAKANAVGSTGDHISLGHSMIVNPAGVVVREASENQEELLYYDI
jgi:omega-amidase